ncbi:MAG TPA: hypothetical protein PLI90_11735 [Rhodocyclaceae bacterium]|nr:hypothetical protein [Rhodocyclaceae bacterium]
MKNPLTSSSCRAWLQAIALSGSFASISAQAEVAVAGWVEKPSFSAFKIVRGGVDLPAGNADLQACDIVVLRDPKATVRIMLANYQRVQLDASVSERRIKVPCGEKARWSDKPLAVLRIIAGLATAPATNSESSERALATRGAEMSPQLSVPALGNYNPMLVAGERSLYVTWAGGVAPYTVKLAPYGGGVAVVEERNIDAKAVRLPKVHLKPGRYVLEVLGGDKFGIKDDAIAVVDASKLPEPPRALIDARLPKADHDLLYAYYLEGWGNGEWTLEALQRAAAISPTTPAARDWLRGRFSQEGTVP